MLNTSCFVYVCANCILSYFVSLHSSIFRWLIFFFILSIFLFSWPIHHNFFFFSWQIGYIRFGSVSLSLFHLALTCSCNYFFAVNLKIVENNDSTGSLVLNFSTYSSIFIHENVYWQIFYAIKGEKNECEEKPLLTKKCATLQFHVKSKKFMLAGIVQTVSNKITNRIFFALFFYILSPHSHAA